MTLLLVTRDLGIVAHYADRVAVIRSGRITEVNTVKRFFVEPEDGYSRRLIESAAAAL
jgi:ABC-type dipeptide/oligopeptide/nickel transport system ATPase component